MPSDDDLVRFIMFIWFSCGLLAGLALPLTYFSTSDTQILIHFCTSFHI